MLQAIVATTFASASFYLGARTERETAVEIVERRREVGGGPSVVSEFTYYARTNLGRFVDLTPYGNWVPMDLR